MSRFWRYFHEHLAWLPIFRPGPLSALAKGLALHLDSCRQDIIWLRDQWIVTRAEAELIARYGESRGMPRFRFDTDGTYRNRVCNAFVWHKLGGKVRGMERIFAENGLIAQVSGSPDPELWAHFRVRINITGLLFGLEALELSFWLANEFKPARSVLECLQTYGTTPLDRHFAAGLRGLTRAGPHLWFAPVPAPSARGYFAACASGLTRSVLRLVFPASQSPLTSAGALCLHGFTRTKICGRHYA